MKTTLRPYLLLAFTLLSTLANGDERRTNTAQQVLNESAHAGKYTFVLFHREDNPRTREMDKTLQTSLAGRQDQATICYVRVDDPQEKKVVDRFGVARAPLPLVIAVAPNGAITGAFPQRFSASDVSEAFASRVSSECIKAIQEGKLVLLCVHPAKTSSIPNSVREFQADPDFKKRIRVVSMQVDDAGESKLLNELEIVPSETTDTLVAFMAPPGVFVGKYDTSATKEQMAAELHAAGKCCNDPHCKHNKQGGK